MRREEATPIYEILAQTPAIPENCQWGLFLRNHDELTLEMVTDEERDYMYAEYAKDPRMKINVGIRRRLAPLLDDGRDEIELMHAILFSLPGSPVLYYGDEIAMGDNVYLGDRDGVRTPMQWTGDRNGGFSRADFAQLYAPPLMDPVYGYQAVNVEAQLRTPDLAAALAAALHRAAQGAPGVRPRHLRAADAGERADLRPHPPLRGRRDAVRAQPRALRAGGRARPLARTRAATRSRCSGARASRAIGELPYLLTLAPRGFYWFQLVEAEADDDVTPIATLTSLPATSGRCSEWIVAQRWFALQDARGLAASTWSTRVTLRDGVAAARARAWSRRASRPGRTRPTRCRSACGPADEGWDERVIAEADGWTVYDALADPAARPRAAAPMRADREFQAGQDEFIFRWAPSAAATGLGGTVDVRPVGVEQSNSSIVFGDELIMKAFRKRRAGREPGARAAALPVRPRASRTSPRWPAGTRSRGA